MCVCVCVCVYVYVCISFISECLMCVGECESCPYAVAAGQRWGRGGAERKGGREGGKEREPYKAHKRSSYVGADLLLHYYFTTALLLLQQHP